ncbi:hypothetical protein LguiB_015261 [Lonicera macranthoides]
MGSRVEEEDDEPLSPYANAFHTKNLNCYIIAIVGGKTSIDEDVVKLGLENTIIKHYRFSSLLVVDDKKGGEMKWSRTKVNLEDHLIIPNFDPNMDSPDQFVEDYITNLTRSPLNPNKPLWELHLLNLKTSDANSIGIFKIHHSMGDGISLISLLLACTRKTSDPNSLPTMPMKRQPPKPSGGFFGWLCRLLAAFWWFVVLVANTLVDIVLFAATAVFLKDQSPLKGQEGVEFTTRTLVHRIVSLDDVKQIKNAMNTTVSDVILGITQAGLSRYLHRKYANGDEKDEGETKKRNNWLQRIRLRALLLINIRPATEIEALAEMMERESRITWGNKFGYVVIPLNVASEEDPLDYIHKAKATIDRKKHSFEALFSYLTNELVVRFFGVQAVSALAYRVVHNTTFCFSSVAGPQEETSFYGHPLAYIAPSVYGLPQALTIHWQSCDNKLTFSLAVDLDVIPNPHQLCNDVLDSLQLIKDTCLQRGIVQKFG